MFGRDGSGVHHHGILAGVSAGAMAVLLAFGLLLLAWHRVAGQVSLAIEVLAYAVIATVTVICAAGAWLAFLWVRHRARNPELLVRASARVLPQVPELPVAAALTWTARALEAGETPAIEPPLLEDHPTEALMAELRRRRQEGSGHDPA